MTQEIDVTPSVVEFDDMALRMRAYLHSTPNARLTDCGRKAGPDAMAGALFRQSLS